MSDHTPAPWTVTEGHRNRIIYGPGGDVIAEVHWWVMEAAAESAANAQLIATAPKLLAALEALLEAWPEDHLPPHPVCIRAAVALNEARGNATLAVATAPYPSVGEARTRDSEPATEPNPPEPIVGSKGGAS